MNENIAVALIVALSSIICQMLINRSNRQKQTKADAEKEKQRAVEEARKEERLEGRLSSIERKLDIHNGYAEKLGRITTDVAVIRNDIQTLKGNS